ncbi:MAG: phosphatase PAP2 family protein [Chloroflexi bacterium]|nr:phosphatase PAP2 family protein [Chloroflexota bacterium]
MIGLARVATGLHYISDIAAGWLLGGTMALAVLRVFGGFV